MKPSIGIPIYEFNPPYIMLHIVCKMHNAPHPSPSPKS